MNKMDELLTRLRAEQAAPKKKISPYTIILAVIGGIVVVGAIVYAIYSIFAPKVVEEYEFDDDDFEDYDDFFEIEDDAEDDEAAEEPEEAEEAPEEAGEEASEE